MSSWSRYKPLLYWSLAALFYLYEMLLRASTGVMAQDLRLSFMLDAEQLGFLGAAYYWAYTPLQIPCGLILDKMGARNLITFSCLLCAIGAMVFALTPWISLAIVARFSIGAGSACAFIGTLAVITGWFSPRHFALMAGVTNFMGCMGGFIAGRPVAWLMKFVGWRQTMIYLSIAGLALTGLVWISIKDGKKVINREESLQQAFFKVIALPRVWLAGIVGGLLYLPISVFAELWAVPFLQSVYHIDPTEAAHVSTALYIGMGLGGPAIAWLCLYQDYIRLMRISAIVSCFLTILIACAGYVSFSIILVCAALLGFVLGAQVLAFTMAKEAVPLSLEGSASSITNALIMFFPLVLQPLMGFFLHAFWSCFSGTLQGGMALYSAPMYRAVMWIFPAFMLLAFIALCFIKRSTYAQNTHS